MVIHTAIGLFQKYHNTLFFSSKIFPFLLRRKAYCLLVLSSICQVLIKSAFFFLKVSHSNLSLIVHRWTECCFTQCIVKSHAYPLVYFFQRRATLCNWATRQIFLFECDHHVTNLCLGSITCRCSGKWAHTHPRKSLSSGRIKDRTRETVEIEPNLCFDCPLLNIVNIEPVLFSHIVSRKDLSKTSSRTGLNFNRATV